MNAKNRRQWNILLTLGLIVCVGLIGLGVSGTAASLSIELNNIWNGNFNQMALTDYQPIIHVQGPYYSTVNSGSQYSFSCSSMPLIGDTFVLILHSTTSASFSFSQSGVTWTQAQAVSYAAQGVYIYTYTYSGYVTSSSASSSLTVTSNQQITYGSGMLTEYSGIASISPVDKTASTYARWFSDLSGGETSTGTTGTSSVERELFIGSIFVYPSTTVTQNSQPTNGFTLYQQSIGSAYLEKISTSLQTANSGTTLSFYGDSVDWVGSIVTFKAAYITQPTSNPTTTPTTNPTNTPTQAPTPTPTPTPVPTATPIPTYTLTTDYSGQGTITPLKGTYTYYAGQSAILTASPAADYQFSYWLINDGSASNKIYSATYSLPMTSDKSALAVFVSSATPAPGETMAPTVEPTAIPVASPTANPTQTAEPNQTTSPTIDMSPYNPNELATVSGLGGLAIIGFAYALVNGVISGKRP